MVRNSTLLVLLSSSALALTGPVAAKQLNRTAPPMVVMPSGDVVSPDQEEVTTVDADGTNTTVYRTRHRLRNNEGMSGYSTGSAATDAFTGALLGNIMGGIVSDQIGGRVKQNKQFQKWFPDHAPEPHATPHIGDADPDINP